MNNIFWAGYCSEERSTAIHTVQQIVSKYGDIVDFTFFSDIALTVTIEIRECSIDKLYDELRSYVGIDRHEYVNSVSEKERIIYLNVTFAGGTGNLKVETPSVPG